MIPNLVDGTKNILSIIEGIVVHEDYIFYNNGSTLVKVI